MVKTRGIGLRRPGRFVSDGLRPVITTAMEPILLALGLQTEVATVKLFHVPCMLPALVPLSRKALRLQHK